MNRQMLRILLMLILSVGLATSASAINHIYTSVPVPEPMMATIMILSIGPVLAVIAGLGRKMKKW